MTVQSSNDFPLGCTSSILNPTFGWLNIPNRALDLHRNSFLYVEASYYNSFNLGQPGGGLKE